MTDRVPVQVRLSEKMHADVAACADRFGISRNAAYTLLLATGLEMIAMSSAADQAWLRDQLAQRAADDSSWLAAADA